MSLEDSTRVKAEYDDDPMLCRLKANHAANITPQIALINHHKRSQCYYVQVKQLSVEEIKKGITTTILIHLTPYDKEL